MTKLILMSGIPGSGKTTYAKKIFGEQDLYISRDEIRLNIIKDTDKYFSKEKQVFDEFVRQINQGLKNKNIRYVVADATHLNSGSRLKLLNRIENRNLYEICLVVMNVPLELALQRNRLRTGRAFVPEKSIIDMYNSMQAPTKQEKIDKLYIVNPDETITRYVRREEIY